MVDSWKSDEIDSYAPNKILIVAVSPNKTARLKFEQQVKNEFELRGMEAVISFNYFDASVRTEKMTSEELKNLENKLLEDGFDSVLFTKIVGEEDRISYKKLHDFDKNFKKFKDDYIKFQDIYYNPDYYNEYKVYHAETAFYCICPTKERELIWKGYVDVIDPISIDETVNDYVNLLIAVLEKEKLIHKKVLMEEIIN
ncbi:hypothetical protein LPB301_11895 [Polaribacter reichenbachii]|uniref:Uncharacterized protein n=2 Tax=Polaribacter reichenbachii TaxID=996801 RepID=A0A1B8TVH2_9FLAO|nr:hypothetical protein LPB301_11895 [Polaribacter reichenbachii]